MRQSLAPSAERVLNAAVAIARAQGLAAVTREAVALAAGVSVGTVSNAAGGLDELRREVLRWGVVNHDLRIVADGLAARSDIAVNAPPDLKARALATLV